ncbi:MAG: family peptidase [Acidimicrobiales bacterium]|nr:family peptidase [Acidimicrobiales bacterium]
MPAPTPPDAAPPPDGPPRPERRPTTRTHHGDEITDPYAWLRDADDPATLPHLEAENAWTAAVTAPQAELCERLFEEIRSRVQETDLSVPYRKGAWWYYVRTEEGKAYARHCRRPDDGTGLAMAADETEQLVVDENVLAEGTPYLSLGVLDVSPDGAMLAYAVDHEGDERHQLRFRDLSTGDDHPEAIDDASYGFAWAADSATCWYTVVDEAERPYAVRRHTVGTDPATDVEVFREDDERFHVSVGAARSGAVAVIGADSAVTSEAWLLDAHEPTALAGLVAAREQGVEYSVAHHPTGLLITSNHGGAEDFAVWRAALAGTTVAPRDRWEPVVPQQAGERLLGVDALRDHLVVHLRRGGLTALRVLDPDTAAGTDLAFDDPVGTVGGATNAEFDTSRYRFSFQSLTVPPSVFEQDLTSGERSLLKQQPVLGDFDPASYASAREWATTPDGAQVPISIAWRPDRVPADGPAPTLVYGYGAYEASMDPWFSVARLSLLDRGVVFAIAHVRGGGEMGRRWYEDGKLDQKRRSFEDFVTATRHLVTSGRADPARIAARGASAGGLLMGASLNLAPDLYRAVVAEVPFVDPLTTMLDPSLPLTVIEREEWGDPLADAAAYAAIKGYSPYENVRAVPAPAVLATAGLNDPRVGFHEPTKWVARLRDQAPGATGTERPVLLKVELGAGHGGPSGRYDAWRDEAFVLAFVLHQLGIDA